MSLKESWAFYSKKVALRTGPMSYDLTNYMLSAYIHHICEKKNSLNSHLAFKCGLSALLFMFCGFINSM